MSWINKLDSSIKNLGQYDLVLASSKLSFCIPQKLMVNMASKYRDFTSIYENFESTVYMELVVNTEKY